MTLIPNYRENLVLDAARVEGAGNKSQVVIRTFDILAFDFTNGRPVPATVLGLPLPVDGSVYAIFNRIDKTRTTLDGERFDDFRPFSEFVRAAANSRAAWAAGSADELSENGLAAREIEKPGADSGDPGARPVEPALVGMAVPSRWK